MGQSAIQEVCYNQYRGTIAISQTSYSTHPHLLWQPHRLYCVFMLESNSLLFIFCFLVFFPFVLFFYFLFFCISVQCCLLQKWGLVNIAVSDVASCLAVFVRLSLHAFSCLLASLSFCLWFVFSLRFLFGSVLFSCHFWGSQSWGCLSCLSVTGRYTCRYGWQR